jgi:hypothetical protein
MPLILLFLTNSDVTNTLTEKMRITQSGVVGIGTQPHPKKQLEINSSNGNCLRLTFNDSDGAALNMHRFYISYIW